MMFPLAILVIRIVHLLDWVLVRYQRGADSKGACSPSLFINVTSLIST